LCIFTSAALKFSSSDADAHLRALPIAKRRNVHSARVRAEAFISPTRLSLRGFASASLDFVIGVN
jgi:hypothetical protein